MLLTGGQLLAVGLVSAVILTAFYLWMKDVPMFMDTTTSLMGKTCIITGANAGIGFVTAMELAKRNARIILACRNKKRAEEAREAIVQATGNGNVVVRELDLSRLSSVKQFCEEVIKEEESVNILVNNAGVVGLPFSMTEDGLEVNFATNYFGPFLLTNLLLEKLKASAPSRIINVSSVVQQMGKIDLDNLRAEKYFRTHEVYFNSKLANLLFTRELARRLAASGVTDVTTVCLHPGSVRTGLLDNMPFYVRLPLRLFRVFLLTPIEGVQTTLYCALADEVKDMSGKYFTQCQMAERKVNPLANDQKLCKELWDASCRLTKFTSREESAM
ncbi:retinol dehydrogenase 12-like [Babylonia areolata]|uniref:retinol dehydrogenase 12-like n=1 Tax=Babylonia areolata TaxID=304850 RepID=UPI003FD43FBB